MSSCVDGHRTDHRGVLMHANVLAYTYKQQSPGTPTVFRLRLRSRITRLRCKLICAQKLRERQLSLPYECNILKVKQQVTAVGQ